MHALYLYACNFAYRNKLIAYEIVLHTHLAQAVLLWILLYESIHNNLCVL